MTTKNQYMVFFMAWVASLVAGMFLAYSLGYDISGDVRDNFLGFGSSRLHLQLQFISVS